MAINSFLCPKGLPGFKILKIGQYLKIIIINVNIIFLLCKLLSFTLFIL